MNDQNESRNPIDGTPDPIANDDATTFGDDTSAKTSDVETDGKGVGDTVHDSGYPASANTPRDGVVLATHDDGTVTYGIYADVARVPADSLNAGPSSTYEPDDSK